MAHRSMRIEVKLRLLFAALTLLAAIGIGVVSGYTEFQEQRLRLVRQVTDLGRMVAQLAGPALSRDASLAEPALIVQSAAQQSDVIHVALYDAAKGLILASQPRQDLSPQLTPSSWPTGAVSHLTRSGSSASGMRYYETIVPIMGLLEIEWVNLAHFRAPGACK